MKKLALLLLLAFVVNSCSTDSEDDAQVFYELIPIARCDMPYRMNSGQTYQFNMHFKVPTTCHYYKGIYFEGEGNTKKIAIQTVVFEKSDCQTIEYGNQSQPVMPLTSAKYSFTAGAPGTVYTFKIWSGKNEQGENTYYDVTVPVSN